MLNMYVALFPILQMTESWMGPRNKAVYQGTSKHLETSPAVGMVKLHPLLN